MSQSLIGRGVPLIDGREKVTGKLKYGADFALPGMLYGKVLRSPLPHARIRNIDTSRAERLPGVVAVVTGFGRELPRYSVAGQTRLDETLLATDKVRFIGDEVAAVAAVDEDTAEEALDLIRVDYEELPAVFDPLEALEPGAPLVHEDLESNVVTRMEFSRGDVQKAFLESDVVVEDQFATPLVHQGYLEPQAVVAAWEGERLTLWVSMQSPTLARITYANALGISPSQIRVIQLPMGGAFGGKLENKLHPICALLARVSGRPVKMVNSRREEFMATLPRVPMVIRMRLGARRDGTILAKDTYIVADNGAYTNYGPGILLSAAVRHDNLYRIKNIHTKAELVYTNKVPTGCFRGFGNPQSHFAFESLLDILAAELSMDPAELRLKNATQKGDLTVHGWVIGSCGLSECIREATAKANWAEKRAAKTRSGRYARGIGLACCLHVSGNRSFLPYFDGASAYVRINEEGEALVFVGETDLGQGARTVFAQIAAEELGIPLDKVRVALVDTDLSPHGLGTFADRATTLGGNAVRLAAADARAKLLAVAARHLSAEVGAVRVAAAAGGAAVAKPTRAVRAEDLEIRDGVICLKHSRQKKMTVAEAARLGSYEQAGGLITGFGSYLPPGVTMVDPDTKYGNISCAYPFVAQVAEVEVDTLTGEVKVLNLTAAHDLGKVINPLLAEGQVRGALAQGLGFALTEQMIVVGGKIQNQSFKRYNMPRINDVPPATVLFVESNDPNGPYGAKGLAEPALTPTAAAIANAVYDAVGVRIKELPITPDKVLAALREMLLRTPSP